MRDSLPCLKCGHGANKHRLFDPKTGKELGDSIPRNTPFLDVRECLEPGCCCHEFEWDSTQEQQDRMRELVLS